MRKAWGALCCSRNFSDPYPGIDEGSGELLFFGHGLSLRYVVARTGDKIRSLTMRELVRLSARSLTE